MTKKTKFIELSAEDLQANLKKNPMKKIPQSKDSEIDFSDIPPLTKAELKKAIRTGRPLFKYLTSEIRKKAI